MIHNPSNPTSPMWRGGASFELRARDRATRFGASLPLQASQWHAIRNYPIIEGFPHCHRRLVIIRWRLAGYAFLICWEWEWSVLRVREIWARSRTFFPFPLLLAFDWDTPHICFAIIMSFNLKRDIGLALFFVGMFCGCNPNLYIRSLSQNPRG
jgi:hypothetical protein